MPDFLFHLAEREEVRCFFVSLPSPFLGLYDNRPGEPPVIFLHKKIRHNRCLLRCILAEELGHHFTSSGNLLAFARSDKKAIFLKQERLAVWWAVQHLIPMDKLIETVNSGLFSIWELAEHFDVTERFMGTSLMLYFQKKRDIMEGLKVLPEEVNY